MILSSWGDVASRKNDPREDVPAARRLLLCVFRAGLSVNGDFPLTTNVHFTVTQCAKSMKSVSTAFWYKCVLFCPFRVKWGLTFRHVNVVIWRSSTWKLVYVFNQYQIFIWHHFQPIICLTRDLMALDAMLLCPNKDSRAGFFRPIHLKQFVLKKEDKWVRLEAAPDTGQGA